MRFDTVVKFYNKGSQTYNKDTGNYTRTNEGKFSAVGNVSDTKTDMVVAIFGKVSENYKTVRIKNKLPQNYDYIEIAGVDYFIKMKKTTKDKQVFYVVEVI